MAIFLIRHGETESNVRRVIQTPDSPLSARGLEQADALGRRLAEAGLAAILSSDLPRAAMTAERLQAATGASVTLDALLQERNFGDVRGCAYDAIDADIFGPEYAPPGGETWEVFHRRVDAAWVRVRDAVSHAPGHLAVVSHGLVCFSLTRHHFTLPDGWTIPGRWGNASLTVADGTPPWRVSLLNCTAHLEADAMPDLAPPAAF